MINTTDAQEWHREQRPINDGATHQNQLHDFPATWSIFPAQLLTKAKNETNWHSPNCASPDSHDEADLCEQRKMSTAADKTVFLGWWQLAFSVLSIIALLYTISLTFRATAAAERAVDISEDIAKRQLRAYVSAIPNFIYAFNRGGRIRFKFKMHNSGDTPAHHVRQRASAIVARIPLSPDQSFPELTESFSPPVTIFPNGEFSGKTLSTGIVGETTSPAFALEQPGYFCTVR